MEAFFAQRDLAAETLPAYREDLDPLVQALDGDRPVTDLQADQVAALFAERWARCAPATWNTRRTAVQAFASWCGERWPLAADPLAGVPPGRRRTDNTRAIPYEDLRRRRWVPLREKLLWRMLYETAARVIAPTPALSLPRPERTVIPATVSKGQYLSFGTGEPYPRASGHHPMCALVKPASGWTLHQLRHSALTHLCEQVASAVLSQAKSRHHDLRALTQYTTPGRKRSPLSPHSSTQEAIPHEPSHSRNLRRASESCCSVVLGAMWD